MITDEASDHAKRLTLDQRNALRYSANPYGLCRPSDDSVRQMLTRGLLYIADPGAWLIADMGRPTDVGCIVLGIIGARG